ncbi:MAG TPA: hypothetical protein VG126_09620 [Thermoleophilaceae bacterium]|nr:hypothetical protein [Thermoleophilaceae bacterium]
MEAVREVETLIRDFDAVSRKQDDTLSTLGVDPERFTEDGRRALLGLPAEPLSDERIELRARRLGVLLLAMGEEPTMDVRDSFAARFVPCGWFELMSDEDLGLERGDIELDVQLASECAALAKEVRARQWTALERLDALLFGGDPGAPMPEGERRELAAAVATLGWSRDAGT